MRSLGDNIKGLTTLFLVLDIIGIIVGFVTLLTLEMFLIAIIVAVLGLCSALLFSFALYAIAEIHDRVSYISYTTSSKPNSSLLKSAKVNTTVKQPTSNPTSNSSNTMNYSDYIRFKQQLNQQNKNDDDNYY